MRGYSYSIAATLVALAGSVAGMGMQGSRYMRDLQRSSLCGVDPTLILNDTSKFHNLISHPPNAKPIPEPEFTEIPIDHDNPSAGMYQNRFWVMDDYYKPGSPILVFDSGESSGDIYTGHLTSEDSAFNKLIQQFSAMAVIWEHRYYGASLPFPVNFTTPPEHFQYLTTRQALADLPYFAANFSRANHNDTDLTPQGTPWVMFGGSYAGIRAALTRDKYPDTIFAAFASSAPVQARVDMSIYFEPVYRGMVAGGLSNCTKDLQAALEYIDNQLAEADTAAAIKQTFFGPGAEQNSNEAFTAALIHIYDGFQNYGLTGPAGSSLQELCNYLEFDPMTNQTAGADGIAPTRGNKYIAERFASWPSLLPIVNYNAASNCRQQNQTLPITCKLEGPTDDPDTIAWSWQYCTEWGFYQSNNFGPHALLSRYQTLAYQQEICNAQFPEAVKKGLLPLSPRAEELNAEFGGWDVRPSNTYFSAGEFDPWTTLTVLSQEDIAPRDTTWSSTVPPCGQANETTVFGRVLNNAEHCSDLQVATGQGSIDVFAAGLREWLPCYASTM